MHGLRDDDGYGSISSGPGKGYNARSYHTFPAVDYEQEKHQSSLSLSSREKGTYEKKTCSFSSLPSSKMARALLMSLLLTLALLLTYSSALPVMSSELLSLLRGRQLSTPPPSDWDDNTVPQNITDFDPESWVLSTNSFLPNHYQNQPYVANGYHGSRVPAEGVGFWISTSSPDYNPTEVPPINGWPLDNPRQTVATISGFWDYQHNTTRTNFPELLKNGGESVISGIPTWTTFYITTPDGQHTYAPGVDPESITAFYQGLSIRNGVLTTAVTWVPVKDGPEYQITFTILAHRSRVNVGMMKVEVTSDTDGEVFVTDILDGAGAQRTEHLGKEFEARDDLIWTAVQPHGIEDVAAYEVSTLDFGACASAVVEGSRVDASERAYVSKNVSTVTQEYRLQLAAGETATLYKYVGIASSDAFKNPEKVARKAALKAKRDGWEQLLEEHDEAWNELWEDGDVIVDGDEVLQISVRATLFHLLSNIRGASEGRGLGDNSISVGGLTSDSYAGLVFWDADLWMLPGLLVLHPDHAAAINEYRFRLLPQAMENAKEYGMPGAMYPWTSSRFGNCTGTGPCADYQYHLNTDIALVHWHQFLSTGDYDWLKEQGWPVIKAVTDMWAAFVRKSNVTGEDGLAVGMYTVHNMTDPDEYANHIDNGAFTNAGVKVLMGIAKAAAELLGYPAPEKWTDIEENIFIPYNTEASVIPEYGGMNGSVEIKQADVVLINYPLEFRLNESQALGDLDFYARAQSPDGPAMTWAMFAINAADLSPAGCASYTYFVYASQPYMREPYYQFSEQMNDNITENGNTNPAFTFLTGHGGFLQIPTHGFTGYRPRLDAFYLDPSLPPQLKGLEIKGMKHQGAVFNVRIELENTTITRVPPRKTLAARNTTASLDAPVTVRIGTRNAMAGDWQVALGESLVIPTRRPDLNGTDLPGNLAQCKPAYSDSTWVAGQFPLAAVDGSNHTTWQPSTSAPSAVTVDLLAPTKIKGVSFNWARYPPEAWTVLVADSEDGEWTVVGSNSTVEVSDPWSRDEALVVRRHVGNVTVQMLEEEVEARWVKLVIEGTKGATAVGATVAQFGLL
ncbi:uncharacterized protein LAJ45_10957 [Morchella importuna]|uniref:uncharacterized protein n=1 Tax=Morchella importuna TaxID=1174673 RepID=UPI001E8EBCCF|nr:uncharacterized protein LAJ45_10957 [Morchella importuna]KAH8145046.1 hypothetical protein LAJ45_10957 [Morchella importuna]